jgi:hypothetical protein
VIVIRYERGVAYVRRWEDLNTDTISGMLEDQ